MTTIKLFNTNEIYNTYNKYVIKNDEYFNRFINYTKYLTSEELDRYKKTDVPRVMSIIDFKEWILRYKIQTGEKLLYTCNSDMELDYINYATKIIAEYPEHDLHTLDLEEKKFNFIIFNQTIEHLYNPLLCLINLYNHIDDNGFLYTTVPTINIPHMTPIHFSGLTPMGLCMLMRSVGFEILECGYWGSKKYINFIFNNNTWPNYSDISTDNKLDVDLVCQAQTWILVKKVV